MDLSLSEEQEELRRGIISFARKELASETTADREEGFSRERWQRCARVGIQGLPVPRSYGGQEADAVTILVALEALGYGCKDNGLIFSLNAHIWSCSMPLLRFGSEQQKQRYLPGLCDGSLIGVQAMTEPGSGSDAFSLATRAERSGDGWILTGSKTFVTNAPEADLFLIFARTERADALSDISAFLVPASSPGLTVGPALSKMGLRGSPLGELALEACPVDDSHQLGPVGAGTVIFNFSMEWERGFIMASTLGTMQRQLEDCIRHVNQREQGGRRIKEFQAVSHVVADMAVRLESARSLVHRFAWMKSQNKEAALEASMAKLSVSEAFLQSSLDALQLHGAYGYVEGEIERNVRDAVAAKIYSGTSEVQRNLIADLLGAG